MDKEKTGNLIKEARTRLGYTQTELGDMLGVSNKAVSRWENGDSFPDVGILENLSTCLNISIEQLISGDTISNDQSIIELIRIVKLQSKESIRRRFFFIKSFSLSFILFIRFYVAFFSNPSIQLTFICNLILMLFCYSLLLVTNNHSFTFVTNTLEIHTKVFFLFTIVSYLLSIFFTIGGFYILQNMLTRFVAPSNIGPFVTILLIINLLINFALFEVIFYKDYTNHFVTVTPIINISTIFICCSFIEWMHKFTDVEYDFRIILITISAILLYISFLYIVRRIHLLD